MEVYTFDKSLQERLVEFTAILSGQGTIVPASQIKSEWSYHVELVIEPVGWQALWKIPRLTCQDLEIHYPTIVVVQAEQVDFVELSALVKIVAVQDEIHLPEKYDVPLIELYPTKNQTNDVLDMVGTSNCIDQLRFFYNHLWMPWDFDDDDNTDWVTLHLEPRLRLFFEIKRNMVNKETADIIRTLVREGKNIHARISRLEADISDKEEEEETKCLVDEGKTCQLMKLHLRLQQIKTEMEVLENPDMRKMLQRNPGSINPSIDAKRRESRGRKSEAYFVWHGSSLENTIECLNKVQSFLSKDIFIKTAGHMQEALDASEAGDNIIIGEGEHQIKGAGGLEDGGIIRGICDYKKTILCAKDNISAPSLLDFSGEQVLLENVTVDLGELQAGILVRKGLVKLNKCQILASNQSVIKLGIVVLSGSKLIAENTTFIGLGTAIVVHVSGEAVLKDCKFGACTEGMEIQEGAQVHASNCFVSDCKEYGIRFETQKYLSSSEGKVGGVELLENISEISLEGCTFKNNKKGDITFKPQLVSKLPKQDTPMEIVS
ncbi:protein nessun dorma [Chelonus insularis]|uniref:protein nessun dorma n=1 Tax=Chelonus insularis TaxID=460826 RepID=UPI00158C7EC2|nr:protein nessun dorma [Chelonus insularis]